MHRNKLIQLIHIARTEQSRKGLMDDDSYRAMLRRVTGKDSCKTMSTSELSKVLSAFKSQGFSIKSDNTVKPLSSFPMGRKIWVLWQELAKAGLVNDNSEKALEKWIASELEVEKLTWLHMEPESAHRAIEMLKQWLSRA
ncbi:regulatory protein GemA [Providencia rettgeri]|uniref:Regulatory protein GemA n=1 Tax=Providencia rettgeri TaxID=587 RepID=A0AAP2JWQ5_PRORE|nr:regulatory protein GemA [Providencia rettgeri]MBX6950852.1 regulatory protein GemA [Providencia rettgeri]MBX6956856.1 regulatory protein GemA [Providencia rettgeri]MBX6960630.1 regulatory protein GemA [Providencia rettgeri]MBX6970515.1 regulatory protein GemA [Providencia rettgeri]MBX6980249.1 regulatory protein GemA [Providencia rettgeri]